MTGKFGSKQHKKEDVRNAKVVLFGTSALVYFENAPKRRKKNERRN
jgi:hypothetical protein